ncbi:MAG: hypothetical protein CM1200mP30_28350 [Pseudomonadota bacterium]|nr:MAG: hypothetical protein CM1200mP30_28350 [Pseudomonadota bacterium]
MRIRLPQPSVEEKPVNAPIESNFYAAKFIVRSFSNDRLWSNGNDNDCNTLAMTKGNGYPFRTQRLLYNGMHGYVCPSFITGSLINASGSSNYFYRYLA